MPKEKDVTPALAPLVPADADAQLPFGPAEGLSESDKDAMRKELAELKAQLSEIQKQAKVGSTQELAVVLQQALGGAKQDPKDIWQKAKELPAWVEDLLAQALPKGKDARVTFQMLPSSHIEVEEVDSRGNSVKYKARNPVVILDTSPRMVFAPGHEGFRLACPFRVQGTDGILYEPIKVQNREGMLHVYPNQNEVEYLRWRFLMLSAENRHNLLGLVPAEGFRYEVYKPQESAAQALEKEERLADLLQELRGQSEKQLSQLCASLGLAYVFADYTSKEAVRTMVYSLHNHAKASDTAFAQVRQALTFDEKMQARALIRRLMDKNCLGYDVAMGGYRLKQGDAMVGELLHVGVGPGGSEIKALEDLTELICLPQGRAILATLKNEETRK